MSVCGRPTRSGQPCANPIGGPRIACRQHETSEDVAYWQGWQAGWSECWQVAYDAGEKAAKRAVHQQEWERAARAAFRTEVNGRQVVEVDGRYAYRWDGDEPLVIGDRVLLPANWLSRIKDGPGPIEGIVTKLGSSYIGPLSTIMGRAG